MKKFLTVLLVIAVMFTFSFSTAFAATGDTYKYEDAVALVNSTISTLAQASKDNMTVALNNYTAAGYTINTYANPVVMSKTTVAEFFADAQAEYETALTLAAQAQLDAMYTQYTATTPVYTFTDGASFNATTSPFSTAALNAVTKPVFSAAMVTAYYDKAFKAEFETAKKVMLEKLNALTVDNYSTDKYDATYTHQTKAQALIAEAVKNVSAASLAGKSLPDQAALIAQIKGIYSAGVGTADPTGALATGTGAYAPGLNNLKTVAVSKTEDTMKAYAKEVALKQIATLVADAESTAALNYNNAIFAENMKPIPNQTTIANAEKTYAAAKAEAAAILEVWKYRLENAEYTVTKATDYSVSAVYDYDEDTTVDVADGDWAIEIGTFDGTTFAWTLNTTNAIKDYTALKTVVTGATGSLTTAAAIAEAVDDLEDSAEAAKAAVTVDADVAINVDAALKTATARAYMAGVANELSFVTQNTAVHAKVHALIGDSCTTGTSASVVVAGKEYKTANQWISNTVLNNYAAVKKAEIKKLVKAEKVALKAATTVEEAEAIFLDYDAQLKAILTSAKHDALFAYGGTLYKAYNDYCKKLDAYIAYTANVMDNEYVATTGNKTTANTLTYYLEVKLMKDKVYTAEELDAQYAAAVAFLDELKTGTVIKNEAEALYKDAVAIGTPVTLESKDKVVAAYDAIDALNDYCTNIGVIKPVKLTSASSLISTRMTTLIAAENAAMQKILDEIAKDYKVTLADKENVEALAAAEDAFDALYVDDLEVTGVTGVTLSYANIPTYSTVDELEDRIFDLEVLAVEAKIAALPANATAAQVAEVRAAAKELGFAGVCDINPTLVAKLNKFEQDATIAAELEKIEKIAAVEGIKIKANSSAKKGSITVKWTVDEEVEGVKYQVYKSTKAQKGYKKAITTSKTSFKNTKNLKKGTRYFYKVRAIAEIDGVKYYSDWSNKANRIAK